ncbi:iron-siderophore ABC transporter substrate-binding protein [uncultured Deefgea sp.]|uniref:iron-siderophore ABC transporter substrate-binding protein n=1 Tax=uncultured Deefgea sp. TaxID=1304914 RepID=UPI002639CD77|nr:iron-siderophore ABC transporter substrate-binding protein [uncultured Deefgea sp.]
MKHLKSLLLCCCLLLSTPLFAAPKRIITLSWEATEYVLALGVTPLAIADRNDYQQWVIAPTLPAQVLDAGGRLEPNLERIYALKPDLIIINPALAAMQGNLQKIAPTILLDSFKAEHNNAVAAEQLQRQLAIQLERTEQHTAFMQQQQAKIDDLRRLITARYGANPPPVCVVRFASPTSFWAYGENSMPEAAMHALGLQNACPQARTAWGTRLRKTPDLAQIKQGLLLHIAPFARQAELFRSPVWQALPVVKQNAVLALPPVWTQGGVYSTTRLAEVITVALLSHQP